MSDSVLKAEQGKFWFDIEETRSTRKKSFSSQARKYCMLFTDNDRKESPCLQYKLKTKKKKKCIQRKREKFDNLDQNASRIHTSEIPTTQSFDLPTKL